ncbi:hypothetical protein B0J11DRAFT_32745 [Dendryphion nanum]|uniref:Uncharacterized protein n=1 Tax=Dendryphion nanum TaxID=256645 RepID=A0A9P9IX77_9PLEO|nr:hypothetical protein B0J11DRAFT_32745 [Dendryphion nanum]
MTDKTSPLKAAPDRQSLLSTSSNSESETSSDLTPVVVNALDSIALQKRLLEQTQGGGKQSDRPWRVRLRTAPEHLIPSFKWFPAGSKSEPSTPLIERKSSPGKDLPLKPCMKQESKSTANTPPQHADGPSAFQPLRRVKTVDFEECVPNECFTLPLSHIWGNSSLNTKWTRWNRPKLLERTLSCPGPLAKGKPADTAITRTDVHVVAIAPSWGSEDSIVATPTMQIVQSNTGCYEVVWDDIPTEDNIRTRRLNSSATEFLQTIDSGGPRGLERVNSKLTEWSWGSEDAETQFTPRVIVFPDKESNEVPQYDCTVQKDDDYTVLVPPNSMYTSAETSRQPSSHHSARNSRSVSNEEPLPELNLQKVKRDLLRDTLLIPDISASPSSQVGGRKRATMAPTMRRLSNMEEANMRFRGHRDSVILARSRIAQSGSVPPELFFHRDSVAMAKKRMHARNHAISSPRQIPHSPMECSDPMPQFVDEELDYTPPGTPKQATAVQNLQKQPVTSMLDAHANDGNRHIRIVE